MSRELKIAADAARLLPAAHLAQLESTLEDADKRCCVCDELISGGVIELAVFFEQPLTVASFAHSGCLSSGVYPIAGLQQHFERAVGPSGEGVGMATLLGRRQVLPRPLLFLEPAAPFAIAGRDPFERYAELLGLSPVSGPVEQIAPPRTDAFTIARTKRGLSFAIRWPVISSRPRPPCYRPGGTPPTERRSSSSLTVSVSAAMSPRSMRLCSFAPLGPQ